MKSRQPVIKEGCPKERLETLIQMDRAILARLDRARDEIASRVQLREAELAGMHEASAVG